MASKGEVKGELTAKFAEFCPVKAKDKFTPKECNKFFKDCLEPNFKYKGINNRIDSSVFSKCKEKGTQYMILNEENCKKFLKLFALECIKINHGDSIKPDDTKVTDLYEKVIAKVKGSEGKTVNATKISKTGGVDRMTDTSQYTGSHKERFTADGKGKGIEGRETRHDGSGYVGAYQGQGTYDAKKK